MTAISRSRAYVGFFSAALLASFPAASADRPLVPAPQAAEQARSNAPWTTQSRGTSDRRDSVGAPVRWAASTKAGEGRNILFYRDGVLGTCAYAAALNTGEFGTVTFTQSATEFAALLASADWDLVVSANQGNGNLGTFQSALTAFHASHPQRGIIVSEWNAASASGYLTELGCGFQPENVAEPLVPQAGELLVGTPPVSLQNTGWDIFSATVSPGSSGATAARGETTNRPVVARVSGNVIVNGFLSDCLVPADNAREVVRREIQFLLSGSPCELTGDALAVGTTPYVTPGGSENQLVTSNPAGTSTRPIHGPRWFTFTPPVTGFYEFDLCGSVGDSIIAIGMQCPDSPDAPMQSLAYNDDACACTSGCEGIPLSSRLNETNAGIPLAQPLTAGVTYRVVVGGFSSTTGPVSGNIVISLLGSGKPIVSLRGPRERGEEGCLQPGENVSYELWIESSPFPPAAGQFGVSLDRSTFVSVEGVFGRTFVPWFQSDGKAGTVAWLVSSLEGKSDSNFTGHVATLTVLSDALPANCGELPQVVFDPNVIPILLASGDGESAEPALTDPTPVVVDGTGPGFQAPPPVRVFATSFDPCQATVAIEAPVAEDDCSGKVPVIGARSDGLALADPFPCGTTVITWTATDDCGRSISQTSEVVVETFTAVLTVAYDQQFGSMFAGTRCIEVRLGSVERSVEVQLSGGSGTATFPIPPGEYACATVDDPLHTLVSQVAVTSSGPNVFVQAFGADALVNGDLNDDNLVNVVDWAIYVVRVGFPVQDPVDCSTLPFHADINGNGVVESLDGNFITGSFLRQGDTPCGTSGSSQPPVMRVRIDELASMIGPDAVMADLNGDGFVDLADVSAWKDGVDRVGPTGARR